jgi:hypothetical protein
MVSPQSELATSAASSQRLAVYREGLSSPLSANAGEQQLTEGQPRKCQAFSCCRPQPSALLVFRLHWLP